MVDFKKLTICEHKSPSYVPRTWHNASSADLTVAFAVDFDSAGERLTKKAALETSGNYIHFDLRSDPVVCARHLYVKMKQGDFKTLNIAGNGVYTTMRYGFNQNKVNQFVLDVLTPVHEHITIEHIVSGGQSACDLAGGIASIILDIPCVMTYPKGYLQRWEDGKDVTMKKDVVLKMISKYTKES
ncbi:hypothetical protein NVP1101O_092 [Vibrio phage 1.101.O._10N.261.45.C6]|nr:hypothetical protein NVP1101O_092 [Vibrio phage 1.101.O._10N.261.45.C6]